MLPIDPCAPCYRYTVLRFACAGLISSIGCTALALSSTYLSRTAEDPQNLPAGLALALSGTGCFISGIICFYLRN